MKNIQIIYSSWGGNTKLVIDTIQVICEQQWITVDTKKAVLAESKDLFSHDLTILACPTYDHGVLHSPMENFLHICEHEKVNLTWQNFVLVWLWDSKYDKEYTIEAAVLLEEFVYTHEWTLLFETLKIHKSPLWQQTKIQEWTKSLLNKVQ